MMHAEGVPGNQLKLAPNDQVQVRPTILSQTDFVGDSKETTAHSSRTTYALSVWNFNRTDNLRSENKTVFWRKIVADGLPSLVGMV